MDDNSSILALGHVLTKAYAQWKWLLFPCVIVRLSKHEMYCVPTCYKFNGGELIGCWKISLGMWAFVYFHKNSLEQVIAAIMVQICGFGNGNIRQAPLPVALCLPHPVCPTLTNFYQTSTIKHFNSYTDARIAQLNIQISPTNCFFLLFLRCAWNTCTAGRWRKTLLHVKLLCSTVVVAVSHWRIHVKSPNNRFSSASYEKHATITGVSLSYLCVTFKYVYRRFLSVDFSQSPGRDTRKPFQLFRFRPSALWRSRAWEWTGGADAIAAPTEHSLSLGSNAPLIQHGRLCVAVSSRRAVILVQPVDNVNDRFMSKACFMFNLCTICLLRKYYIGHSIGYTVIALTLTWDY